MIRCERPGKPSMTRKNTAMNYFKRFFGRPNPKTEDPQEHTACALKAVVELSEWTVDEASEQEAIVLVPKVDNLQLRCQCTVANVHFIDVEIDAGIRMILENFHSSLPYRLLEDNRRCTYGSYRVASGRGGVSVTLGGFYDTRIFSAAWIASAMTLKANHFHGFINRMIQRGSLVYPVDFMGYPSSTIALKQRF